MSDPREAPTGTLAEEALRLIETLGLIAGAHEGGETGSETKDEVSGEAKASAECCRCPVCRLLAGVRQLRPEVLAHLVAAARELLAAVREFTESSATAASSASTASSTTSRSEAASKDDARGRPADRTPASRTPERIELD